jgi:plastocyanin
MSIAGAAVALLAIGGFSGAAQAQDAAYSLTIRNHHFEPSTLNVKAGVKIKLTVTNAGTKPAEFESAELNREKVIAGGSSGVVFIGPLQPGSYPFFDDFDQANQGRVIAK